MEEKYIALTAESSELRTKNQVLYNADPNCDHDIEELWSGIKCRKCSGWYCL